MRYAMARFKKDQMDLAYRFYISDTLYFEADQKRLTQRFRDVIKPKKQDHRSGDEIALDVIHRLGLKVE